MGGEASSGISTAVTRRAVVAINSPRTDASAGGHCINHATSPERTPHSRQPALAANVFRIQGTREPWCEERAAVYQPPLREGLSQQWTHLAQREGRGEIYQPQCLSNTQTAFSKHFVFKINSPSNQGEPSGAISTATTASTLSTPSPPGGEKRKGPYIHLEYHLAVSLPMYTLYYACTFPYVEPKRACKMAYIIPLL